VLPGDFLVAEPGTEVTQDHDLFFVKRISGFFDFHIIMRRTDDKKVVVIFQQSSQSFLREYEP